MGDAEPVPSPVDEDERRVQDEYARRAASGKLDRYYARNRPALDRADRERRALVLAELDRLGDRAGLKVLDVGCGHGGDLAWLTTVGCLASNLAGIDLVPDRVATARANVPGADIRVGNGAQLPFADGTFDMVAQSVALSSVIDAAVRSRIAAEMVRVTRSGGRVCSYDLTHNLDRNPHLVPINLRELARLFGADRIERVHRLTLLLPIASRAPAWLRGLATRIPALQTHLLAVIRS